MSKKSWKQRTAIILVYILIIEIIGTNTAFAEKRSKENAIFTESKIEEKCATKNKEKKKYSSINLERTHELDSNDKITVANENSNTSLIPLQIEKSNLKNSMIYKSSSMKKLQPNYTGCYVGTLTKFTDGLDGTVEISNNIYTATDDMDYNSVAKIWLEKTDKTII